MLAYHLEIQDEGIADKVMAFLNSLPANSIKLQKEESNQEIDKLIEDGFKTKIVGTSDEVFARLRNKYAV